MTDKTHDPSRPFVLPAANVYEPGSDLPQSKDPASVAAATGCCEPSKVASGCCAPSVEEPAAEAGCCGSTPKPAPQTSTPASCC